MLNTVKASIIKMNAELKKGIGIMKTKVKQVEFAGFDHVKVVGIFEYGANKGEEFEYSSGDFIHTSLDDAIWFFEKIANDLKEIKKKD